MGILVLVLLAVAIRQIEALPRGQRAKPVIVGVLTNSAFTEPAIAGFRAGMAELGWVDGGSIRYLYDGATADLDAAAAALVARGAGLLLTLSTPATLAARKAGAEKGIPVLFAPASDPVGTGLADSLAQPGGLTTGVTFGRQEPVRLQWLVRLVPGVRRVLVPYNPADRSPVVALAALRPAAEALGLELVLAEVRSADDIAALAVDLPPVDAVFVPPDTTVTANRMPLIEVARARRIPVSLAQFGGMERGVLFSYGFSFFEVGRQAARMADQVLRGVPPGSLPIETADFFLSLNLAAAQAIGLDLSDSVLRQARLVVRAEEGP